MTPRICAVANVSVRPSLRLAGRFLILASAIFVASVPTTLASDSKCQLLKKVEFPITMTNLRPLTTAKINGSEVQFILDSGAFFSMISGASAARLDLKTYPAPPGLRVAGVGGTADVSVAMVKVLTVAGASIENVEFLVGGTDIGSESVGVLGQNFLKRLDVEYDLSRGVVRLLKPVDCDKTMLAYWAIGTSTPYSVLEIASVTEQQRTLGSNISEMRSVLNPKTMSVAYVNGTPIRVEFDTGAATSVLSLKAAARAGIKPDSPGVVDAGATWGIGKGTIPSYNAPVASFKIGDEEIKSTRLRIADIDLPNADMLLGADFFLAHRIYVANSQHKLYFTYAGGPVFNLAVTNRPKTISESSGDASASAAASADASSQEPKRDADHAGGDAADYSRRGEALASRREFDQALASLTRACELAPGNPDYLYQRGIIHWQLKQPEPAMADFDQALKLKPDHLLALISRGELHLETGNRALARTDLDAADAAAAKQSNERYRLARDYERADVLERSVTEFDLWIDSHADDARLPGALNDRCWARALLGVDLAFALKDCNAALKRAAKGSPLYTNVSDSRGLVLLRMGEYDKSIADYDASLKINPKNAWSLYGRGIDKLRKRENSGGEADIAQATAIWPQVADEFKRRGITP
jgi:tetratricopeptide (TPR) repeat protein